MPNRQSPEGREGQEALPVQHALDQSKDVKQAVEQAADELAVVHAVLDKEVAEAERSEEVDRAIAQTDRIEKKLSASAERLERVVETLDAEVRKKSS